MDAYLLERIKWLVRLRWLAVAGIFMSPAAANFFLYIKVDILPIYLCAAVILTYNIILFLYLRRFSAKRPGHSVKILHAIANGQIAMDLIFLTVILHFTGGLENPFMFFFLFHVVISSIILNRLMAFLQAAFVVALFLGMGILEYNGIIEHHVLDGAVIHGLYDNPLYIMMISIVFIGTVFALEYLVSSIAKKLNNSIILLQEKDRIKSEYVLRVSHDIKGHLAAVQSTIHPVTSGIVGELNEKQKDLLGRAEERTNKLLTFVKSLLNLTITKLKDGKETEIFEFDDVLRSAVTLAEPDAAEGEIQMKVTYPQEKGLKCDGSKAEIQATFLEIISNAIKYTPPKGTVTISALKRSYSIRLTIADSGIGIPKDEIDQIFNEFYRSSIAKTKDGSSGLGLAMAKHVIEKHGGKILVESEQGKGTTFIIELPAA